MTLQDRAVASTGGHHYLVDQAARQLLPGGCDDDPVAQRSPPLTAPLSGREDRARAREEAIPLGTSGSRSSPAPDGLELASCSRSPG